MRLYFIGRILTFAPSFVRLFANAILQSESKFEVPLLASSTCKFCRCSFKFGTGYLSGSRFGRPQPVRTSVEQPKVRVDTG